ncbi:hypothetical protein CIB84_015322 [Bambusicola thoracicus]|uniref:Uncharacterized protein n=1 Tax=Bambusicola thoracicus TaxID=9083 RepID=A0A2P4S9Z2_BAMTH|nr:hypothetical protein CIB84_015322 [Bambusicola thoracicus]
METLIRKCIHFHKKTGVSVAAASPNIPCTEGRDVCLPRETARCCQQQKFWGKERHMDCFQSMIQIQRCGSSHTTRQNRSTFTTPKAQSLIVPCSHQCESAMIPPQPIESHQCKGDVGEIAIKALVPKLIVFAEKKKDQYRRCSFSFSTEMSNKCCSFGFCSMWDLYTWIMLQKTGPYSQQSC